MQVTTFTFRAQATTCSKHHTRTVTDAGCECASWVRSANPSDSWVLVIILSLAHSPPSPSHVPAYTFFSFSLVLVLMSMHDGCHVSNYFHWCLVSALSNVNWRHIFTRCWRQNILSALEIFLSMRFTLYVLYLFFTERYTVLHYWSVIL